MADSSDSEIVFAVEEAPEGGFVARALGVPIFTEADTFEELHAKVREAVKCHFDEAGGPKVIPEISRGVISLDLSKCSDIESRGISAVTCGSPRSRAANITSPYRIIIRCA